MAKLQLIPNETQKTQDVQNQQIFVGFQNIYSWSNAILTENVLDYVETNNYADETTTYTTYTPLKNFDNSTLTVKNPLCIINFTLSLKGQGYIALLINNKIIREIPFNNLGTTILSFSRAETFNVGKNSIGLQWKVITGTVTKSNSFSDPGWNQIQVISINS